MTSTPADMCLLADSLAHSSAVRHGFFTRRGGVSTGIFASLNCGGRDSAEPAAVVDENRARVAHTLGLAPAHLLSGRQIHSARVAIVTQPWTHDERPEADALVTREAGLGLGILTADCVPVLFADTRHGVVGAAHAGWRGASGGVLQATITAMVSLGARRESTRAAIGPAIMQASYEVDAAFYERFTDKDAGDAVFFTASDADGRRHFDLPCFVERILRASALANVERLAIDTYADEERFYSFRRATHRGEPDYGRQLSVIALTRDGVG